MNGQNQEPRTDPKDLINLLDFALTDGDNPISDGVSSVKEFNRAAVAMDADGVLQEEYGLFVTMKDGTKFRLTVQQM